MVVVVDDNLLHGVAVLDCLTNSRLSLLHLVAPFRLPGPNRGVRGRFGTKPAILEMFLTFIKSSRLPDRRPAEDRILIRERRVDVLNVMLHGGK